MKYKYRFKFLYATNWLNRSNISMKELDFEIQGALENYIEFICDRDDLTTEKFLPVIQNVVEEGGGKLYHVEGGKIE